LDWLGNGATASSVTQPFQPSSYSASPQSAKGRFRAQRVTVISSKQLPPMASQQCYQYIPLENGRRIRLLCLEPGDAAATPKLSLFNADLDQQPTYEALSYTWGDPNDTTLIYYNEEGSTLAVTRNCEAALRRLRLEYEERTLWIDAICIDQGNIDERGRQVRLMSAIYKQAQGVIAYLGDASHESQVGMDFILHDLQVLLAGKANRPSVGLSADSPSSPQQMAIDHILSRPYFERI